MADFEVDVNLNNRAEGSDSGQATGDIASSKPQTKVKKNASSGIIAKGIKGVLKGLGIASAVGAIAAVVKTFNPLVSMIGIIIKMISLFLSPIADVVLVLLYPILLILKPIVVAVNQIMAPFIKQGMKFMREGVTGGKPGGIGAGVSTIFAGLQAVIILLFSDTIKLITTMAYTALATVVGMFSEEAKNTILTEVLPSVNGMVDTMAASAIGALAINVDGMGKAMDSDMSAFRNDIVGTIDTVFPALSNTFIKGLGESLKIAEKDGAAAGLTNLTSETVTELTTFGTEINSAIDSAWGEIIDAFNEEMSATITNLVGTVKEKVWNFAVGLVTVENTQRGDDPNVLMSYVD